MASGKRRNDSAEAEESARPALWDWEGEMHEIYAKGANGYTDIIASTPSPTSSEYSLSLAFAVRSSTRDEVMAIQAQGTLFVGP